MFDLLLCEAIYYYLSFDGHQPSQTSVDPVFFLAN